MCLRASFGSRFQQYCLFWQPAMQILVTELGDETFIIAAIMAMRHPRLVVYAGAMSALGLMTVRSLAEFLAHLTA